MKYLFTLIAISLFISVIVSSCGESKKEEVQDNQEQMTTDNAGQEQEMISETPVAEKTEEMETKMGDAPVAQESEKANTPLKYKVVLLDDVATGNYRKLTNSSAAEFLAQGKIFVAKGTDNNIYVVYTTGSSLASKRLSMYAENEFINIQGTTKSMYGVNVIISDKIEPAQ